VHDPIVDRDARPPEFDVKLQPWSELVGLDALILAVPHRELVAMPLGALLSPLRESGVLLDLKSVLDPAQVRPDVRYWSL
jgi:UDP-N-acetyl-D-galactosamine dehydrogenase